MSDGRYKRALFDVLELARHPEPVGKYGPLMDRIDDVCSRALDGAEVPAEPRPLASALVRIDEVEQLKAENARLRAQLAEVEQGEIKWGARATVADAEARGLRSRVARLERHVGQLRDACRRAAQAMRQRGVVDDWASLLCVCENLERLSKGEAPAGPPSGLDMVRAVLGAYDRGNADAADVVVVLREYIGEVSS